MQILGRGKGHSAVAAAAYRARGELRDARTGRAENYTRKDGHQCSEILLPEGAAPWLADRERLWNHVEAMEKRADAQLAREINIALPHELTDEQRYELVREFVREQFVSRGMVADVAWHRPVEGKGDDRRNYHAHVMLTLRQATPTGLRSVKTREWNSDELLNEWRRQWEQYQNRALERLGHADRVDHRTLEAQRADALARGDLAAAGGLDRVPEIHVGTRATNASRRGYQPTSRPREVGLRTQPRGSGRGREGTVRREVRYPQIDGGSRRDWNARLVEQGRADLFRRIEHRERQMMWLRQREARAQRTLRALDRQLDQLARGERWAAECGRLTLERSRAERHSRLSRQLLRDIERLLALLFQSHVLRLERHRALTRLGLGPESGRGRNRTPDWLDPGRS